jgi:hypothetical protein
MGAARDEAPALGAQGAPDVPGEAVRDARDALHARRAGAALPRKAGERCATPNAGQGTPTLLAAYAVQASNAATMASTTSLIFLAQRPSRSALFARDNVKPAKKWMLVFAIPNVGVDSLALDLYVGAVSRLLTEQSG